MHGVLIVLYLSQEKGYVLSLYSVIVLKKDSIFAIPNITYNSEPVSISVVGIFKVYLEYFKDGNKTYIQ